MKAGNIINQIISSTSRITLHYAIALKSAFCQNGGEGKGEVGRKAQGSAPFADQTCIDLHRLALPYLLLRDPVRLLPFFSLEKDQTFMNVIILALNLTSACGAVIVGKSRVAKDKDLSTHPTLFSCLSSPLPIWQLTRSSLTQTRAFPKWLHPICLWCHFTS